MGRMRKIVAVIACALLLCACSGGSDVVFIPDPGGPPIDPEVEGPSGGGGEGGGGTPVPTILSVSPRSVFDAATTAVEIRGTDLQEATTVTFGTAPAPSFVLVDPNHISAMSPAGLFGAVDVKVTGDGGTGRLPAGLTYVPYPIVAAAGDVRLDSSPGATPALFDVRAAADGQHFYVAWAEPRAGGHDIFVRASHDGGRTWNAVDRRVNTNASGASSSLRPEIACSGSRVYVVWMDNRNGHYEPFFNRSIDGGDTWSADTRLSPASGNILTHGPSIACEGETVLVTWADDRNAAPFQGADVWANRSTNGGATWLATDARVSSTAPGSMRALVSRTRPVVTASTACVAWIDWRNGASEVFLDRSSDDGATWQATDLTVDTDATATSVSDVVAAADGGRVHVAWRAREASGDLALYARSSADGGASFVADAARVNRTAAGASTGVPAIACRGAFVHLVWADPRDGKGPEVWANRSTDGGATWGASDVRLGEERTAFARASDPAIACNGTGAVHVAWSDDRDGASDVRVTTSVDDGATWAADEVRLDTDTAGSANSQEPAIACAEALFFVAWKDDRDAAVPLSSWDVRGNGNAR